MNRENDVVRIYFEDLPMAYARIESIMADHKPGWYHVKLLLLNFPPQVVTWILKDAYVNGETFTMNGKKMRLEKVVCPPEEMMEELRDNENDQENDREKDPETPRQAAKKESKVISLKDLKKNK